MLGLTGFVANDSAGVRIQIEGGPDLAAAYVEALGGGDLRRLSA